MTYDDVKKNVMTASTWRRLLYMIMFLVVFMAVAFAGFVLVVFQFFTTLIAGQPNPNLIGLGRSISRLLHQVAEYLLYCTEDIPFGQQEGTAPAVESKPDNTTNNDSSW